MLNGMAIAAVVAALALLWWVWERGGAAAEAGMAARALAGFWEAPADFCVDAGLSAMQLMISEPQKGGRRLGYLTATNEEGAVIADSFLAMTPGKAKREGEWVRFAARFKNEERGIFPERVDVLVDAARGRARIHGQKKVWAVLEKDAGASAAIA